MRLYYDFHIHSALSPCANDDMTPNNIVNMSILKGLDVISVCDHNCAENLKALAAVAQKAGLLFLPGIEINTAEEVHLIAYFEDIEAACAFGSMVYKALPNTKNNENFFGKQLVIDKNDQVIGKIDKLLISALPYSLDKCIGLIVEYGGFVVPAHINKGANSILNNLGFLPEKNSFKSLEVVPGLLPVERMQLSKYQILHSSDAHELCDISEQINFIIVKNKTIKYIIQKMFL